MDRRTLTRDEALELVRRYKRVISARFDVEPKVIRCGAESDDVWLLQQGLRQP